MFPNGLFTKSIFPGRYFPPSGIIVAVVAGIAGVIKKIAPVIIFNRVKAIVEFKK